MANLNRGDNNEKKVWLVEWMTHPIFITEELEKAVEIADKKSYELAYKDEELMVMKHKERDWLNMTISEIELDKEIRFYYNSN